MIDALVEHGAICVRGDEDDAVGHRVPHVAPPGLEHAALETRDWSRATLSQTDRVWLQRLPPEHELEIDGKRIAMTHAYPGDYERYLQPTDEELLRTARAFPHADVIVLGHTHRRGLWHVGRTTVITPGSVGQPACAGCASFAILERGAISFGEAPYDLSATLADVGALPVTAAARAACAHVLRFGASRPTARVAHRRDSDLLLAAATPRP